MKRAAHLLTVGTWRTPTLGHAEIQDRGEVVIVTLAIHARETKLDVSIMPQGTLLVYVETDDGPAACPVTIDAEVDVPAARASFKNGVLDIVLPKLRGDGA